jgi:hypothetical protein
MEQTANCCLFLFAFLSFGLPRMMGFDHKRLLPEKATNIVAVVGCALRLYHYLRNPSVWHDEAALIVNVLDKSFTQLLGPLRWNEAGPPLFLWAERAVALLLGDSTFTLRLLPLLASCASVLLFTASVRRMLSSQAKLWAVLLFACSDRLLWHACEAKPYSVDVFLATGVLFTISRIYDWPIAGQLLVWTLLSPVMIFTSFPACFLIGALFLLYLPLLTRKVSWRLWWLYAGWMIITLTCFLLLYFGPIQTQRNAAMDECWTLHFPEWSRPWTLPVWTVASTAEVFRYCFLPIGYLLAPIAFIGTVTIWRSEQRGMLTLLLGPLALAWLAACLHGYPYGGSRLEVFALPGLAILVAVGAEKAVLWLPVRRRLGRNLLYACLLLPVMAGVGSIVFPWPRAGVAAASSYIQARCQPQDCVRANHWEYEYYFRQSAERGEILGDQEPPSANRVWLAITTPEAINRQALLQPWLRNWRVVEVRDFMWTTVWLLERQPRAATEVPPVATGGQ